MLDWILLSRRRPAPVAAGAGKRRRRITHALESRDGEVQTEQDDGAGSVRRTRES